MFAESKTSQVFTCQVSGERSARITRITVSIMKYSKYRKQLLSGNLNRFDFYYDLK